MEHCIRTAKQIEEKWKGSGFALILVGLQMLAGNSTMLVANKGFGKTSFINSVVRNSPPKGYRIVNFDQPTRTELALKGFASNDGSWIENEKWLTITRDVTSFNELNFECFYSVVVPLIYDKEFEHTLGSVVHPLYIRLKNCKVISLVATTPEFYSNSIVRHVKWHAQGYDRFLKLVLTNGIRDYSKDTVKEIPDYDFKFSIKSFSPKILSDLRIVKGLFKGQMTESRINQNAERLIKAFAYYEGYDRVGLKEELEFKKLFWPYISLWDRLSYRNEDPTRIDNNDLLFRKSMFSTLDIVTNWHSNESCTMENIMSKLGYMYSNDNKEKFKERYLNPLVKSGLVKSNSPNYELGDDLHNYWNMVRNL